MPDINIVDSTWLGARPNVVAAVVAEPSNWSRWWPDIELEVAEARGTKGMRWTVRRAGRNLAGSMEVWLEPVLDGVVAHFFLRLDRADGRRLRPGRVRRESNRRRRQAKLVFWTLGDCLDPGRIARISAPPGL